MSDDELLNLSAQAGELLPEARSALQDELGRRKLSGSDISEYQHYLKQQRRFHSLRKRANDKKRSFFGEVMSFKWRVGAYAGAVGVIAWLLDEVLISWVFRIAVLIVLILGIAVVLKRKSSRSTVKYPGQ